MAAKLLHSLTEENPDLSNQIGCMTGIIQLFDRQNLECQPNKNIHDKRRQSAETSRPSFSSSSRSSSFSSLDFTRTAQPESLYFDSMISSEVPSKELTMRQLCASPHSERQNVNLRDVVRDCMYRELREMSVKTTTKEATSEFLVGRKDLPRPLNSSKVNDAIYRNCRNERQNLSVDLEESLKDFAEARDIRPWYLDEPSILSRSSSYQLRDGSLYSTPKDAPRYSYDERGRIHSSYGSHDSVKQTLKLKELPRLSLDSRESSMRSFNSDTQSSLSKSMQKDSGRLNEHLLPGLHQTYKSQQRPPSVVAKLMGLESLPNSASNTEYMSGYDPVKEFEASSRSSKVTDVYRPIQAFDSSRNARKEPTSPRWRNPDPGMKPISRASVEPAPWRLLDGTRGSQKVVPRNSKSLQRAPSPFPSVYSEIENRLKDLEFRQSGKDLRALKQILESMQVKGQVNTSKEGHGSKFPNMQDHEHLTKGMNGKQKRNDQVHSHTSQRSNSSRISESPIVIMKPAKSVKKPANRASDIPLDRLSNESRRHGFDFSDKKNGLARTAKDQIPKSDRREHIEASNDMKSNFRTPRTQKSTRQQQLPAESTASSVKCSGSISPRLQQKRLELEKRSRPPISPSDSSKSRRQQSDKQQPELSSPGGRCRPKSSNLQPCDDQISEISSESKNSNFGDNDNSLVSDEVNSSVRSGEINGNKSPLRQTSKYTQGLVAKKRILVRNDDESVAELGTASPEYPSPISVLDGAVYSDSAPSPSNQKLETQDNSVWNSNDKSAKEQRHAYDSNIPTTVESGFKSEVSRKKLQSIDQLVQKLRRLNSGHDEARTDYIASLCENTNPDDRYISEILLASGLLLRDLGSNLTTFQFHQSGDPINPELFLVLEQTKASNLHKESYRAGKIVQSKSDNEKCHRKLIFDAVNEVLNVKLACLGHPTEPWLKPLKVTRKTINAQKLLRELCFDIEQLQAKKPGCSLEDENDGLKSISWEDVLHRSESFTDFQREISGLVLDIERSLFKDLVGEIVAGESSNLRQKASRPGRQLFVSR
ncbi:hypothetical protein DCAR_0311472 [Daucus carota subsp. sativus]|uniref:DUF4378 domain-containing protein n=1 Tax=Daucus carota subsp. sativus TaxID=79200 RepID=A0AAF0WLK7_DAUCS|nr:hypothetical protein DCAR_0311472 [Daucus carota subsp. sativus]